MTIKKMMVPFFEQEMSERAFNAASAFAKEFKAHLDVVHMRQRITPSLPGNVYYPIAVTYVEENFDILQEVAEQRAAELKKKFKKLCSERSVSVLEKAEHTDDKSATATWTDTDKNLPYDLATRARVADITIMARPSDHAPQYTMDLIEEIIFQSGQSVLIVGQNHTIDEFPKTVMVAWDGGREAARAVRAALPVLQRAETVTVTAVGELPWGAEPAENLAAYLKLHGVHANHMHPNTDKHDDPEEVLLGRAKSKGADLIVMGAYSHNRWREMVLGGFTRFMLRHSDIPLLMAH